MVFIEELSLGFSVFGLVVFELFILFRKEQLEKRMQTNTATNSLRQNFFIINFFIVILLNILLNHLPNRGW